LPSFAVDRLTGDWLRGRYGQAVHLRAAPIVEADHRSVDVYARIDGRGSAPGRVYVVGHYDSWHPSECAFDNALGAAALVQLAARAAASPAPERDVVFLATSGEEQGLQGALAWVDAHQAEVGPADLVLVLDVVWSNEGSYLALATDDPLRTEAMAAAEAEGLDVADGGQPGLGSDHVPFVGRGAGAIWLGRWPDRHYHTVADTLDALDFDEASAAVRANWRLLAAHAGFPR
jgi:Zn-dependent M28 family amino/carboxypeptidase